MDLREQLQTSLGDSYSVERELGGGGMSRVFLARDNRLRRDVVVKLLRPELVSVASIERFKREIELLAVLQHPHIVPLLSAGSIDDIPYYTMPFVRGQSLRARLKDAPLPSLNETLHILRDIAEALAHAHAEGVVHRDIKPDNVLLSGGVAVVTDFGVAKAIDAAADRGEDKARTLTSVGVAPGTPAYMSPEQASADPNIDLRADLYSFGCVAYELLTGVRPFAGRSPQEAIAAHVLEAPEPLASRCPDLPDGLTQLVMRCLEKRPAARPQSAAEVLAALDTIAPPATGMRGATWRRLKRSQTILIPLGTICIAAMAMAIWARQRRHDPYIVQATRVVTALPELEMDPAISPDGKLIAYAAGRLGRMRIFVRQLDGRTTVPLSSAIPGDHHWPQWSPDGSRILFVAKSDLSAYLGTAYVVPYVGGVPQRAMEGVSDPVMTPVWSPDGRWIVYSNGVDLFAHDMQGGTPRRLAAGGALHSPSISPDGRIISYVSGNPQSAWVLNSAASSIWTIPFAGGTPTRLTDTVSANLSPAWMPDGRSILFVSDAQGERDVYQQALTGERMARGKASRLTIGSGAFSVSPSRTGDRAVYAVVRVRSRVWRAPIHAAGTTPADAIRQVTSEAESIEGLDISRDGMWLVYDSNRSGNQDIYKMSLPDGAPIQLTTDPAPDFVPQWSPDGSEIAYYAMRTGNRDVRVMSADGRNDVAVTADPLQNFYPTWSPTGHAMAFLSQDRHDGFVVVASRAADGTWSAGRRMTDGDFSRSSIGTGTRWSPDGKWIAHGRQRDITLIGATDGVVRTLPWNQELRGRLRWAAWGRDPGVVYIHSFTPDEGSRFWAVPVSGGSPRLLLALGPQGSTRRQEFATDGRYLYFTLASDEADIWTMDLKR